MGSCAMRSRKGHPPRRSRESRQSGRSRQAQGRVESCGTFGRFLLFEVVRSCYSQPTVAGGESCGMKPDSAPSAGPDGRFKRTCSQSLWFHALSTPPGKSRLAEPDGVRAVRVIGAPREQVFTFLADLENHWLITDRFVRVLSLDG